MGFAKASQTASQTFFSRLFKVGRWVTWTNAEDMHFCSLIWHKQVAQPCGMGAMPNVAHML